MASQAEDAAPATQTGVNEEKAAVTTEADQQPVATLSPKISLNSFVSTIYYSTQVPQRFVLISSSYWELGSLQLFFDMILLYYSCENYQRGATQSWPKNQ